MVIERAGMGGVDGVLRGPKTMLMYGWGGWGLARAEGYAYVTPLVHCASSPPPTVRFWNMDYRKLIPLGFDLEEFYYVGLWAAGFGTERRIPGFSGFLECIY